MTTTATDALHDVAQDFLAAYESSQPIQPPRETIPNLDVTGAYRIQQLQEQAFIDRGEQVVGRKIGLTSLAMQRQLGVDSPDFGFFTDAMMYRDTDPIPTALFIAPKVEPELAFRLGRDLPADPTLDDVAAAVDAVYLAVEIIDSRVEDWNIALVDTIADNASCGAVILSEPVGIPLDQLAQVTAVMTVNGTETGRGTGSEVMGHPLEPLKWLAGVLAAQSVPLKAGDIILTGSFCGAAPVTPGADVEVDYGTFGKLNITFF
ncbi:2-keto-4-pentenoate hydratase [Corynebacterium occultum]|uniref:2-keto-4-pentenoate hydratase n=1 Tax=Corynebacterium occultum TaxID=2675219 RepID=A0A6B8W4R6_9CORY|nr:fumarylacetoacetate hydrolase family protein [Corynebacterium occultum]QGU06927.1 2-keto-4-pentenoate hydratase [Corynebacterium occultum]